MESGALDGKLFSTSFMFEKFANWTALHVGKMRVISFRRSILMCYFTPTSFEYAT